MDDRQSEDRPKIDLSKYDNRSFKRGRSRTVEALWLLFQKLFVSSWMPGTLHRIMLLKLFGARIGTGVRIKPGVRVKFPWRLGIGNNSWIGEDVWVDNLADVEIGANCIISQGAYLCTGSHDWSKPTSDLIIKPIFLRDGAWVAARAVVAPGVTIEKGAILAIGSVATSDLLPWTIYQGCPAMPVRTRVFPGQDHA